MMNKCAKFHEHSPYGEKVKFNLPSAIELSETADFVYNFVLKPYAIEQLPWLIWPTFPLNFFMKFSQKMPLNFFYTTVQKSQKTTKNPNQGGSCLKRTGQRQAWRQRRSVRTLKLLHVHVHDHFMFRSENGQGRKSYSLIIAKILAETNQPQAQPPDDWRPLEKAIPFGSLRPWEKFCSAQLSREKGKLLGQQKAFVNTLQNEEPDTKNMERNLQRPMLKRSAINGRRRDVNAHRRSIELCFFLSTIA